MVVVSSYAVGMDVTEHFERHKFLDKASADKVRAALKELKVPAAPENVKPWYMWTKATKDRNSSFGENVYTLQILSVEEANGNLVLNLNIESGAETALLGYEVLRDGQVIGFTKDNTFSTAAVPNDGKAHTYKVRAFDLRLNVTGYSKEVSIAVGETENQQNLAAATENNFLSAGRRKSVLYLSEWDDCKIVSKQESKYETAGKPQDTNPPVMEKTGGFAAFF